MARLRVRNPLSLGERSLWKMSLTLYSNFWEASHFYLLACVSLPVSWFPLYPDHMGTGSLCSWELLTSFGLLLKFHIWETWRRKWQPIPVLLPGRLHGWRSLVGCSPWGHKELDTTERLHLLTHLEKELRPHPNLVWERFNSCDKSEIFPSFASAGRGKWNHSQLSMKCNFPKGWLHLAARHGGNMHWETLRYSKDSQGWPLPCWSSKAHCPPSCPVGLSLPTPPHWLHPKVRGNKCGWGKIIHAIDMGRCERMNCFLLTCAPMSLIDSWRLFHGPWHRGQQLLSCTPMTSPSWYWYPCVISSSQLWM